MQTGTNERPGLPIALVVGGGGMGMSTARRLGQSHRVVLASQSASKNADRETPGLAGSPLGGLRGAVLERLRGPLGCTHLNDMLRALACGPALAGQLPAASGG